MNHCRAAKKVNALKISCLFTAILMNLEFLGMPILILLAAQMKGNPQQVMCLKWLVGRSHEKKLRKPALPCPPCRQSS